MTSTVDHQDALEKLTGTGQAKQLPLGIEKYLFIQKDTDA